jgi:hypothetical protein
MADEAERLRTLNAILRENADGANYNAKAIAANVDQLRAYRIAADDAMAAVETFIKERPQPEGFRGVRAGGEGLVPGRTRSSSRTSRTPPSRLAEAFTGGYDAVAKLDDATNFLSATERQHIRTLFDEGKASRSAHDARSTTTGRDVTAPPGTWIPRSRRRLIEAGRRVGAPRRDC